MSKKFGLWLPTLIVLCFVIGGCNTAVPSPTSVPPSPTAIPPLPTVVPTLPPLPTDSPPINRVPAIKNVSQVTGLVVKVAPDSSDPTLLLLTIKVTSTSHVEPYPSFTDDKVGQEIEILIDSSLAELITPTKSVNMQVTYRGDEHGGFFYGSDIAVLP
jgi:hypothetical protein